MTQAVAAAAIFLNISGCAWVGMASADPQQVLVPPQKHAHTSEFNLLSHDYNITAKASQETFQEAPVQSSD